MQPPHQHSRINLAGSKAEIVRKLGPERSKQYFNFLNRFLSLKLNKVEFNKICPGIVGRENIPLHNQFIRLILRNACTAKVPPPANEVDALNATIAVGNKEPDVYQQNGSHPAINQPPNPPALSNGDILPLSPRKARSRTRDRKVGDRRSAVGPNGKANYMSQQSLTSQSVDFNVLLENGESIPPDIKRAVQHHQGLKQQAENEVERLGENPAKLSTVSEIGTVSVHSTDQTELFSIKDGEEVSARRSLRPPLGIPFCAVSPGGARRVLSLASSSKFVSSFSIGDLLDTTTLKQHMEQIAISQGLEGVPVDCANVLNNGLDAYLKGLIRSCLELVSARTGLEPANNSPHKHQAHLKLVNGFRPGHHYQMQRSSKPLEFMHGHKPFCPISLLDFKVAVELNPRQLGENWTVLLEKICSHAFEGET